MKKQILMLFIVLVVTLAMSSLSLVSAAIHGEVLPAETPMLITNAGQGPGGKMGSLLVSQAGVLKLNEDYWYNAEPWEADLQERPYKTLLAVIGSSAKGLGASGITIDEEIARLNVMVEEAKRLGMRLVAVHLEGKARRGNPGSADERSIDAIAPFADHIIVVKDGDQDGRFSRLAQEKDIPITLLDTAIDFTEVAKRMFAD